MRSLIKTGDIFGAEFCYHEIPDKLDVYDVDTAKNNPTEFYVVCTDIETGKPVSELIDEKDMGGVDENELKQICEQVVNDNPKAIEDYKNGKEAAFKSLVGGVMKATRGKADALKAQEMLREIISK